MYVALDNDLKQYHFRKFNKGFQFTIDRRTKMTVL